MNFSAVEPFGDERRQWAQIALVTSLLVKWKTGQAPTMDSLMGIAKPKPTKQQLQANFETFFGVQKELSQQKRRA